ncbi:Secreted subtilisin-like serine protease sub11 [Myotisia sp. PD_48]|nr:Secreted subtilisin-like serine protease sub11 [Myotisia sp. PD_48]
MTFINTLAVCLAALSAVDAASLLNMNNKANIVKDAYIVVMKDRVSTQAFDSHVSWVSNTHQKNIAKRGITTTSGLKHQWDINGWKAYSGSFDEDTLREILRNHNVNFVEPDRKVKLSAITTQRNAPSWGLGRASHKQRGSRDYVYDDSAGKGITFYGVDTGIDINHSDFSGRIRWGINTVDSQDRDCHGHGTHTAGTVAGTTYGLAKKADIVSVKVLDCQGSGEWSGVIEGINWCVTDAKAKGVIGKAVMNLSIGGEFTQSVNDAASQAQAAGIFLAVAAGNENVDARNSSPASAPDVCTTGATDSSDRKASFSNYGSILDIYAPGVDIQSTMPNGRTGPMSGTSMAAPHVAGVGAYLMVVEGLAPGAVCDRIKQLSTASVSNPGPGTTNKLLYNNSGQ